MQCVILVGGYATRMRPITEKIPKSMIEIDGCPFIDYQLNGLISNGINNIVLCIGHLGNMIKDHIGNDFCSVKITYVDEGEDLTGTGGAIRKAYDQGVLDKNFGIMYGDSFLQVNFQDLYDEFNKKNYQAMMTVFKNNGQFDTSNVSFDGNYVLYDKKHITKNKEEFTYIDWGFSILSRDLIEQIPQNKKIGLDSFLHNISIENKLVGYIISNRFYEIGSFSGLNDFKDLISEQKRINNF